MKGRKYCSHCGAKLNTKLVGAETVFEYYGESQSIEYDSAYNEKTGERQFVLAYECPNYVKRLFFCSPHDSGFFDEIVTKKLIKTK